MFIIITIREMQLQTTLKFDFSPIRMTKMGTTTGHNVEGDAWKWKLHSLLVELQTGTANLEISVLLKKLTITLPYDPTIQLFCICTKNYSTGTCKAIFTATVYTIVRRYKQHKCSSVDK